MKGEGGTGAPNGSARVLIVDDHDLVRGGYHRMLDREPDLEVIGEASDGWEAVELCRELRPDLILMDVRMPTMDGLEATRRIKAEIPTTSVLMVTTYDNPDYLLDAIKAGAAGYILKDAPKSQLISAVRRTLNGESPLNQELATQLIQRFASEAAQPTQQPDKQSFEPGRDIPGAASPPSEDLTPRELEVLELVARGKTNREIGRALIISQGTAKAHVQNLIRKLDVSDRTQAAVRAVELGMLGRGASRAG